MCSNCWNRHLACNPKRFFDGCSASTRASSSKDNCELCNAASSSGEPPAGQPKKKVYFDQVHYLGDLCASDFTHMGSLGVTIAGQSFDHMLYHFVLTYSNWESVSLCYSESFESLSQGFQDAIGRLGFVPKRHRTDRLSAAVNNLSETRDFTVRYQGLMDHYGIAMEKIQARHANENGDVESSHRHIKNARL
jgi:hypothetical protein